MHQIKISRFIVFNHPVFRIASTTSDFSVWQRVKWDTLYNFYNKRGHRFFIFEEIQAILDSDPSRIFQFIQIQNLIHYLPRHGKFRTDFEKSYHSKHIRVLFQIYNILMSQWNITDSSCISWEMGTGSELSTQELMYRHMKLLIM